MLINRLVVFNAIFGLMLAFGSATPADGPADNKPDAVRVIPPPGMAIDPNARQALLWRCKAIQSQWRSLLTQAKAKNDPIRLNEIVALEPEVLVFPRAVELALEYEQFYRSQDLDSASNLLDEATNRISRIQNGGSWPDVVGIHKKRGTRSIIGGFKSDLDDSYQPYGLVVPASFEKGIMAPHRLDLWFHGRGEKVSEVQFLNQQINSNGQYTPDNTFVLHPYGRYSNAFKFAGEVDVLEVLSYVQAQLPIDSNRLSVRGFSMGGAGCWQFATHYPDRWFAANPGAGFSETPEFLAFFQNENVRESAPSYQQTLWNLYDCPPWSRNLRSCPTIAYSGEIDKQKQAADIMATSLEKHGIRLTHIIGPDTGHKIHPDSKIEIETRLKELAKNQAASSVPPIVDFTTYTLRYNRQHWITILGLEKHWNESYVRARVSGSTVHVETKNISEIEFSFAPGQWITHEAVPVSIQIDGQTLKGPLPESDQSWNFKLSRESGIWCSKGPEENHLQKRPGLQGPVDDAFMSRFLFVLPSRKSNDPKVEDWVQAESIHAMQHWRKHFRGDIRRIKDSEITDKDIKESNLILFGDNESNSIIQRISQELPLSWGDSTLSVGSHKVPKKGHIPILIYPNPLNPKRYVVLNSGFTFREYDYLNNARQTPKLPDWALVDITSGSTTQVPGKVVHAGFFNEAWSAE